METLTIPEGVTDLNGYGTFGNCSKLKTVILPKSIKYIADSIFIASPNIENIILNEENEYFIFENGILMPKDRRNMKVVTKSAIKGDTFTIPEGVVELNDGPLHSFSQIKKLVLSESLKTIVGNAASSSINSIELNNNKYFTISNNCLCDSKKERLVMCFSKDVVINIEEGIKTIEFRAFTPAVNCKTLNLPDSLETIEAYAISGDYENLKIGKNLKNLGSLSISGNITKNLEIDSENQNYKAEDKIIYSKDGTVLLKCLHNGTKIVIPDGVKNIGDSSFKNKTLEEIVIPETVTTIGAEAFRESNLKAVEIPKSVKGIGRGAFTLCNNLNKIVVNNVPGSIPGSPWGFPLGDRGITYKQ